MAKIPNDLIRDMMLWLPGKTLFRFQLLSKEWQAIITSEDFVKDHLSFTKETKRSNLLLRAKESVVWFGYAPSEIYIMDRNLALPTFELVYNYPGLSLNYPGLSSSDLPSRMILEPEILGSVDGLIAIMRSDYSSRLEIIILNPSIRKVVPVPPPQLVPRKYSCSFGKTTTGDYKVVIFPNSNRVNDIHVFGLSSSSWKLVNWRLHNNQDPIVGEYSAIEHTGIAGPLGTYRPGVHIESKSSLYWLWKLKEENQLDAQNQLLLVQFDLDDELIKIQVLQSLNSNTRAAIDRVNGEVFLSMIPLFQDLELGHEIYGPPRFLRGQMADGNENIFFSEFLNLMDVDPDRRGEIVPLLIEESGRNILMQWRVESLLWCRAEDQGQGYKLDFEANIPCRYFAATSIWDTIVDPRKILGTELEEAAAKEPVEAEAACDEPSKKN